jgi:hypothetical protein
MNPQEATSWLNSHNWQGRSDWRASAESVYNKVSGETLTVEQAEGIIVEYERSRSDAEAGQTTIWSSLQSPSSEESEGED